MKQFLDDNFLLKTKTAQYLYHNHASKMPIYDYHCHISPKEIYEDRKFESITDMWIVDGHAGDHYKWRALRGNGVGEKYITGDASKKEKFLKWAETIPYLMGNPLYHWTHLEMKRFFGINELLSPKTADKIYDQMNKTLETLTARKIIKMANVKHICTTDDPIDDLRYHILMKEDATFDVDVYPTFRPDKAVNIELNGFVEYINKLSKVVGYEIVCLDDLEKALSSRVEFFNSVGCRVADHALDDVLFEKASKESVDTIFRKTLANESLTQKEVAQYKGYIVVFLGKEYHKYNWAQQYHIKALRNNNSRMMSLIGPDTGFDSINDGNIAKALSAIMNSLDSTDQLPKTILYSLNPSDNEVLCTLAYCFQKEGIKAKIQLGSGWWFLDQKDGMQKQMTALSHLGLFTRFIGMLTDSRSFLSYTRHEYFRRILCNFIGDLVENGEYPDDLEFLGKVVEDICYNNAKEYFDAGR